MILLKTPKNELWQFFYEPNRGICQRRGSHIPQILYPDGTADFDASCDRLGNLHLIATNRDGDLVYFAHDGRNWQQMTLLKSRGTALAGQFRLIPADRWQNLFYTLKLEDRTLLVHHIIDAPAPPTVLDRASGAFACGLSDCDDLCIYYRKEDGTSVSRQYIWSQKNWTDPRPIPLEGDPADCLHIPDFGFVYLSRTETALHFLAKEPLTVETVTRLSPTLAYTDGVLWILWEEGGRIRGCRSEDSGLHFDPPTRFLSPATPAVFEIRPTRFLSTVCNRALGDITDGISSLFIIGSKFSAPFPPVDRPRPLGQEIEDFAKIEKTAKRP